MPKKTFAETFSQKIIENLKQGTAPWQMPWEESLGQAPLNPVSGTTYKGVNRLNLTISSPNEDPRWVTFKQAQSQKWKVKKGSVAEKIVFWSFTKEVNVLDEKGKPILDENGEKLKETVLLERPIMNQFSVFHASQLETEDGKEIPFSEKTAVKKENLNEKQLEYFNSQVLNLKEVKPENLVRETMKKELSTWFLSENYNVELKVNKNKVYLSCCLKLLEENPYEVIKIINEAEKTKKIIMGIEMEEKQELKTAEIKEKIYLNVPFKEKEEVKTLGANWDNGKKQWFISNENNLKNFEKWLNSKQEIILTQENTYLNVPFREKDEAKKLGAKWDIEKKSWYAPIGSDLNSFQSWDIKKEQIIASPILSPQEEFKEVLLEMGLIINEPLMDGSIQRVAVLGAENGKDGAYQAYADGTPNGWVQNHKTGEKIKWVATGQVLNSQEKEKLALEVEQRQKERLENRNKIQNEAIKKAAFAFHKAEKDLSILPENYLENKGFSKTDKFSDVRCFLPQENSKNYVLLIPGYNKNGQIQTVQYINQNGEKNFAKDCPKKGALHIIDLNKNGFPKKLTEISDKTEIYIAEGYATGASINLATDKPVVVAFDAGNLAEVAKIVREAHPKANIIICADHDHKKETNVGLKKASEAGKLIKAKVVLPLFNNTEKLKGLTDFNDLHVARQGENGLKAVLNSINQTKELER